MKFDYAADKAKVELVKDIVSIANSGGGAIVFGADEINRPGIDARTVKELDSAKIADLVEKYVKPSQFTIGHNITELPNSHFILEIEISSVEYPIVMSRVGNWKGSDTKKDRPLFLKGDVWIRHSTKNERINYEDLRRWIQEATKQERDTIFERITTLVNLPKGANIQVVSQSGEPLSSPKRLLENAFLRRERDANNLLTSDEVLWIFQQRENSTYTDTELKLLIGSALRRGATLFWWLIKADANPDLVLDEIDAALIAKDRDKSDAARNVVELASIFANDEKLEKIITHLEHSKYKHFRDEAKMWISREVAWDKFKSRIEARKFENQELLHFSDRELENIATDLSVQFSEKRSTAISRKLSDVNRALWIKQSKHAIKIFE